jgi:hypothetical protein
MRVGYIMAYVREVGRSVAFCERAFGLKRRFVDESGQYAAMKTGETALAFASNEIAQFNRGRGCRHRSSFRAGSRGDEGGRAGDQALGPDRRLHEVPGRLARERREPHRIPGLSVPPATIARS